MDTKFESASRSKLRFPSPVGELTTEQLWDLPLLSARGMCLDNIARAVNANLKAVTEDSFVSTKPDPRKAVFELQLEIVKHIIAVKQDEAAKAKDRAARAEQRRKLLDALAVKEEQEIGAKSKEDILKELAELDTE